MDSAKAKTAATDTIETARLEDFSSVVERYQSLVWAVAYSTTGDQSLSEDVAQETFLAAWNQQADIRDLGKLKGYLATIARNLGRKAIRGSGRERLEGVDILESAEAVDMPGPLDEIIEREELTQVAAALEQIPPPSREAFVLFYAEGQSVKRVADDLEISQSAVKQRLHRARESLKDSLEATLSQAITTGRPSKAFATATMTLIVARSTTAGAAGALSKLSDVPVSEAFAKAQGTPASWLGALGKTVGGATLVALAVLIAQAETSGNENFEAAERTGLQSAVLAAPQDSSFVAPSAHRTRPTTPATPPTTEQAAINSKWLASRLQEHWPDADIDGDGQLSEDEILVLRDLQEDELTERIIAHWQDEPCGGGGEEVHPLHGVTCAFVEQTNGSQAYEGFIPYNLYGLRSRYEEELEAGLEMDVRQWLAGKVATAQNSRICYQITALPHDEVHRLRSDAQGDALRWVASATFADKETHFFSPPRQLRQELEDVGHEFQANEVADRWGLQLWVVADDERRTAISHSVIAKWDTLPFASRGAIEAAMHAAEQ